MQLREKKDRVNQSLAKCKDKIEELEAKGASEEQLDTQKNMAEMMEEDLKEIQEFHLDTEDYKSSLEKLQQQISQFDEIIKALSQMETELA